MIAPETPVATRDDRVRALTTVAMNALVADGAAVAIEVADGYAPLVYGTGLHVPLDALRAIEHASLERSLLVFEDASTQVAAAPLASAGIGFFASVSFAFGPSTRGFLCAFGRDPRALGGAQEYVLRTLTAQIADIFLDDAGVAGGLRLFETVLGHANDSIVITEAGPLDAPGPRIVYANATFTKTTGYDVAEVLGKSPRLLQGPQTDPEACRRIGTALRRWESIEIEMLNYRKDGTKFWVELSIVPVADETGRFTHWVSVQRDVSERRALEERAAARVSAAQAENAALAYRVNHDDLTGLANRPAFLERVAGAIVAAGQEPPIRSAVFFLDLDRFKTVNDSLGHRAGDLLLIEIARRLRTCMRPTDVLARLGGDEFVCLVDDIPSAAEAAAIAGRLTAVLAQPVRLSGQAIPAFASIGIRLVDAAHTTPEDVMRDADTAMYRAKNDGGGRFAVFDDVLDARGVAALRSQVDIAGGVARGEFVVHYQPIVEMASGRVTAFEALVRWNHPERGLIFPGDFIEAAEDSGAIVELGRWVLEEACHQTNLWNRSHPGARPIAVSVNVSSRQLDEHRFLETLQRVLERSGIDPRALILEITESVFIEHTESVGTLLERIRALGVRVALDDFGTGYSSLSYLERYRVDTLKIDRTFVTRLATSETTTEIVRLIVGFATALGMTVTAEGIEEEGQRAALDRLRCSHAQGYFFGRAMPAADVPRYLEGARQPEPGS